MSAAPNKPIQWHRHQDIPNIVLREKLIDIGDSLWYSTAHKSVYNKSDNGMVNYSIKTDNIDVAQYPHSLKPKHHNCCQHKGKIYLIDGVNGEIIIFNPLTKTFKKALNIPKVGGYPTSIVTVHDTIHIFNGRNNRKKYLIYNINENSLKTIDNKTKSSRMDSVSVLLYQDQIITMGGYNKDTEKFVNNVMISSKIKSNDTDAPKWTMNPKYQLPIPLGHFGHILFKHYVIIFGGNDGKTFKDSIYSLDLQRDDGWQKLMHVKCPVASNYIAGLASDNKVHLYTMVNKWPDWKQSVRAHYSMPISAIIEVGTNQDESKCAECAECEELRTQSDSQKVLIDDLLSMRNDDKTEMISLTQQNHQ